MTAPHVAVAIVLASAVCVLIPRPSAEVPGGAWQVPDRAVPIFRDDRGVLCAMAYLIARSGRTDIVDRVARTRNFAYIRDLADDISLLRWLDGAGLTVSEAARIQPIESHAPAAALKTF